MLIKRTTAGGLGAAAAFLTWGLLPIYWKALDHVPAYEILCHRIVWSLASTAVVLALVRRLPEIKAAMASPRNLATLTLSAFLITTNWGVYIWAVNNGYVLESSLGYYITPLSNTLMGRVFLGERLSRAQTLAILLAAAGVANLLILHGSFPAIALTLAVSFSSYGLVRKTARVEALPGLFVETLIASVPAGAYLVYLAATGQSAFSLSAPATTALLVGCGPVTTLPLLLFVFAARRIMLSTVGIFQFIAPTCFFFLGVFAYHEPFTNAHLITFSLIWIAITTYAISSRRRAS